MKWIIILAMFLFSGCYTVVFNVDEEDNVIEDDSVVVEQYHNVGGYTSMPMWYTWDIYSHEYYWDDWRFWWQRPVYYPRPPLMFVRPHFNHYNWNRNRPSIYSKNREVNIRRDGGMRRDINNPIIVPTRPADIPKSRPAQERRDRIIQDFNKNKPIPPVIAPRGDKSKRVNPRDLRPNNSSPSESRRVSPPRRQEPGPTSTPQSRTTQTRPDNRSRR